MGEQKNKKWYKKWWVWVIALLLVVIGMGGASEDQQKKVEQKPEASTAAPATPAAPKWDGNLYYDQIQTGMTRAQVEQITQKGPQNCTTSQTTGLGTMEMCTYGNALLEEVTLNITYLNGAVYNKTKLDL